MSAAQLVPVFIDPTMLVGSSWAPAQRPAPAPAGRIACGHCRERHESRGQVRACARRYWKARGR